MGNSKRIAQKDIWKGSMAKGAVFSPNDIPFCPTTSKNLPTDIITWTEAITIYNKEKRKNPAFFFPSYIAFYEDDYKFDGPNGIWRNNEKLLQVAKHFEGVITPDFSTYQDFPDPIKRYATYRMRLLGFWLGRNGIAVINNVRWGTSETYQYCFDGIQKESVVAIGTVGGSPRKLVDRSRFNNGINYMVELLCPRVIIVYGSANYECFKNLENSGIEVFSYPSKTNRAFEGVRK